MRRFYKDERGSSLVLTIIAMTFISLLAVAVISMTVTNIRLKIAQKGSQKNFYNTDTIMDEVRAGVEDLAAKAAIEAYKEAFESYNASLTGSSGKLSDKYEKKFLEEMIKSLSGGKSAYGDVSLFYKDEVLQAYLMFHQDPSSTAAPGDPAHPDRYVLHNGSDAPGVLDAGKSYGYMELQDKTLLLKDVVVTMKEGSKEYKTTLTSDIRVTIPPMTADTYSEYMNYALIADNQVIAAESASVEGNVYAGTVNRYMPTATDEPEAGILVRNGKKLNIKAEQLITRGDLLLSGGSEFSLDSLNGGNVTLWAENIFTKGNSKNTMTMTNTVCNISDDMEIGGKNDDVTISGQYFGYNYNKNYKDNTDLTTRSQDSQDSSSILINGREANLNLLGLNALILSGRTFISKKPAGSTETDAAVLNNKDIAMGESLSVKGAQIAYYVPSDFVTISTSGGSALPTPAPGSSVKQFSMPSDPATIYTFDYGKYMLYLYNKDPNTATEADLPNNKIDLLSYLDSNQPLMMYYRHDISVETNSVTYFYLNFKDDTQLTKFYEDFKNFVPRYSTVKDTNAAYLGTTGILVNEGANMYHRSGTVLSRDPSGDLKVTLSNESNVADSQLLQKYARMKSKEYLSRQLSLVDNYQKANEMTDVTSTSPPAQFRLLNADGNLSKSGKTDDTNVYNLLIDATEMAAKTGLEEKRNNSHTGLIIIEPRVNEKYTWDSAKKASLWGMDSGIIIAAGDVEVKENFSGLIIAGGNITFARDSVKVTADSVLLEKMFTEDKAEATPMFYKLFSQYFQKVVDSAIGQGENATKDTVFYERWKKE